MKDHVGEIFFNLVFRKSWNNSEYVTCLSYVLIWNLSHQIMEWLLWYSQSYISHNNNTWTKTLNWWDVCTALNRLSVIEERWEAWGIANFVQFILIWRQIRGWAKNDNVLSSFSFFKKFTMTIARYGWVLFIKKNVLLKVNIHQSLILKMVMYNISTANYTCIKCLQTASVE